MIAENHAFFDDDRNELWKMLPLDTPLSLGIDPSTVCNFRCKYCAQSVPEKFSELKFKPEIMSMETFKLIAEQIKAFPHKIKKVHLECKGEPLCNPDIAQMVAMLKETGLVESVQIITNAALLTHKMADQLIAAGLDILGISVQGMTAEKYQQICNVTLDFEQYVKQIRYFYEHKGNTKLYIKTIDLAMEPDTEKLFYKVFGDISDRIYIEKIAKLFSTVDYSDIVMKDEDTNRYGEDIYRSQTCGFPFYYLLIFPNGDVRPCANIRPSALLGNVHRESLVDIWNGKKRMAFLKMQLKKRRLLNLVCRDCQNPYENLRPEDRLDGYEALIMEKYGFEA